MSVKLGWPGFCIRPCGRCATNLKEVRSSLNKYVNLSFSTIELCPASFSSNLPISTDNRKLLLYMWIRQWSIWILTWVILYLNQPLSTLTCLINVFYIRYVGSIFGTLNGGWWFPNFLTNGPNPASFCLFLFCSHDKHSTNLTINYINIYGVLGTRTLGSRMVGADESTVLWRPPL